jgi:hypothetical protein
VHEQELLQLTCGRSWPPPEHFAPHAPLPHWSSVSKHADDPCPQSTVHDADVPQLMTKASQLSVALAHVTLQLYSAGQSRVASSQASLPSHCNSHENPGGHTMVSPIHPVEPQTMTQLVLFGPLQPPLQTSGHVPPGGTGCIPQGSFPAPPIPPAPFAPPWAPTEVDAFVVVGAVVLPAAPPKSRAAPAPVVTSPENKPSRPRPQLASPMTRIAARRTIPPF